MANGDLPMHLCCCMLVTTPWWRKDRLCNSWWRWWRNEAVCCVQFLSSVSGLFIWCKFCSDWHYFVST